MIILKVNHVISAYDIIYNKIKW